jgi:GT2 family glycosyltransferase
MRSELDIVIVSHRDGGWLEPCLRTLRERSGGCRYRVLIVENGGGEDLIPEAVRDAPEVELMTAPNRGFAAGNNAAMSAVTSERVLFLNPDTELVDGTQHDLVAHLDRDPDVDALAVRQLQSDGTVYPSLRRFPGPLRAFAQALAAEKWPKVGARLGERVTDLRDYERTVECDWTTGAVLLVRRQAFEEVGGFDERFFMYSEETDLCRRLKRGSRRIVYVPDVAFVHHAGKAGYNVKREAQMIFGRMQYAEKHMGFVARALYRGAYAFDRAIRAVASRLREGADSPRTRSYEAGLRVALGRVRDPPLRPPSLDV